MPADPTPPETTAATAPEGAPGPALRAYVADLRRRLAPRLVPGFDPRDGGAGARVLLVLEKPGPGVAATGLISRDNADATARAVRAFLEAAALPREETAIWNVVPAWNGTIKVTAAEVAEGLGHLGRLLPLLPALDTVVLVGARARRATPLVAERGLRVLASDHPSPQVRAAFAERWAAIPSVWARARRSAEVDSNAVRSRPGG